MSDLIVARRGGKLGMVSPGFLKKIVVPIAVSSVAAALAVRLFALVDRHAVNILFWDQWDFFGPLFRDHNLWDIFSWQSGPHRMGIGLVC